MSAPTLPFDVSQFCSGTREGLKEPIFHGDRMYATDGRILIEVPASRCIPQEPDLGSKCRDILDDSHKQMANPTPPRDAFTPTERRTCDVCRGSGKIGVEGKIRCYSCEGAGETIHPHAVRCGNHDVSSFYLEKLQLLPDVKWDVSIPYAMPSIPIPFTFDGGRGCVMGMRRVDA